MKRELWTLSFINNGELDFETIEGREDLDRRLAEIDDPDSVCLCEGARIPFAKVTRVQLGSVDKTEPKPRRKRRTREQIEADNLAAAAKKEARANGEAKKKANGVEVVS